LTKTAQIAKSYEGNCRDDSTGLSSSHIVFHSTLQLLLGR
jgi:hypothetical protein